MVYRIRGPVEALLLRHVGCESAPLLDGIGQLMKRVGEFDPATIEFESFRRAWIAGTCPRERRFAGRIGVQEGRPPNSEIRFDPVGEKAAENVRPCVILGDPQTGLFRLAREGRGVGIVPKRQAVVKIDPGVAAKRLARRHAFRRLKRIGPPSAKGKCLRARDMGGKRGQDGAIVHQPLERGLDAVPFQHCEFRRVESRPLAVAEHARQREDFGLTRRQQLLHREFRRCMQVGVV